MNRRLWKLFLRCALNLRGENPGPIKRRFGSWLLRHLPGMLTCREFEAFVYDYHEGAVSRTVRRRFETHMRLCPMCSVHFDCYLRTVALGKRICADDLLPDDMPDELVGAILLALAGAGE